MLLRLALPLAVLAVLWHLFDGPEALRHLAGAQPGWLAAALGLLSVQIVASALRWRLTAARLGQPLTRAHAVREYYLATLANMALPGGILGDAGRALRARAGVGIAASAQAVVIERLAGQVALFALLMAALVAAPLPWPGTALWVAAVAAVFLAALIGLRRGPGPARRFGAALRLAWLSDGVWRRQLGLSVLILGCNIGAFAACAAAVGATVPPGAALVLIPLTLAAMLVPVSVGGWGLREGAAAALWPLAGGSAEGGIAASMAFGLLALAASLPGALVPVVPARAQAAVTARSGRARRP
ncbi:lysylphosphatidylglycerol synthetase family protein [Rhodobacteraceae bacterium WD3A24]|nr:lysylphosphatidylglycerol synthetase family protein [Rhodobacteraceae bacterium WD3A24]